MDRLRWNILLIVISLGYLLLRYSGMPHLFYYPLENIWQFEKIPGAIFMGWYSIVGQALGLFFVLNILLKYGLRHLKEPKRTIQNAISILAVFSVCVSLAVIFIAEM